DHPRLVRPHDDRTGPVHRRIDPRRLLDRHRGSRARVAVQRRDPPSADGHARGDAPATGSRVAHGRRHVRDRGEPDVRRPRLVEWMEEKGVAGELTDPKYRDEAVRIADYRQGTAVRDGIRRLIAACKGEEVFHRAQSYGISWGLVRAPEENYDVAHYRERGF